MKYQQLTEGLRYQIACLRDHGLSQAHIAKQIGVHPSTISRELRRHRNEQGYLPQQAHLRAIARRLTSHKRRYYSLRVHGVARRLEPRTNQQSGQAHQLSGEP